VKVIRIGSTFSTAKKFFVIIMIKKLEPTQWEKSLKKQSEGVRLC